MPRAFSWSKSNPDPNRNNTNYCLSLQRMNQIWIHFLIGHRNDAAFAHRPLEDAHGGHFPSGSVWRTCAHAQPSSSQRGLRGASQTKLQMFQWIGVAGHNEAVQHAER